MNGVHDMGGMHGFGPIRPDENQDSFHAEWEKRVPGIGAAGWAGIFNIDEFRYGIERMDPAHYLTASYYERHLATFENNFVDHGLVGLPELDARTAEYASGERDDDHNHNEDHH
jgi:nitrile hydratase